MLTLGIFFLIIGYVPAFLMGGALCLWSLANASVRASRLRINGRTAFAEMRIWFLVCVLVCTVGVVFVVWGTK